MWSFVTGEMPPQSLMPASRYMPCASGVRFGGAWMFIRGPRTRRAVAMVRSISKTLGSSRWRMAMSSLTRKFWTITSWIWRCSSCRSRIAMSESTRSSRVSPMPMRMPVVQATFSSPAMRIVRRRSSGTLPGQFQCAPPFSCRRSETVSSIMPIEALTSRSETISSRSIRPWLMCGWRPVSRSTSSAISRRYDDVVVWPKRARSARTSS